MRIPRSVCAPLAMMALPCLAVFDLGTAEAPAAPRPWQMLRAPRFTVLTQLREGETRDWAEEFHQFTEELDGILDVPDALLPPLTVVIFAREKDFDRYRPLRPDGRSANVAGFFSTFDSWSVTGMSGGVQDEELRRTIFHEGVHWFVSASSREMPRSINEGMAEVFSTFESRNGTVRWGKPIPMHIARLQREWLPLKLLLEAGDSDPVLASDHHVGIFYAESWAFVHYLLYGVRDGSPTALVDYIRAREKGIRPADAIFEVLGSRCSRVDLDLRNYIKGGSYTVVSKRARGGPPPMSIERAGPAEIEMALGRLALGSNRMDLARSHADTLQKLDPTGPGGFELHAFATALEWKERRDRQRGVESGPSIAIDAVGRRDQPPDLSMAVHAMAGGSQDAWIHLLAGTQLLETARARGHVGPRDARAAADAFQSAIKLRPTMLEGYSQLAGLISHLEPVESPDLEGLVAGRTLFPDDSAIALGLALALSKQGRRDEGEKVLDALAADPAAHSGTIHGAAQQLRESWMLEREQARITALVDERRYADAIGAIDSLLPQIQSGFARTSLLSLRRNLEAMGRVEQAREAVSNRRWDDARRILREVHAMDRVPAPVLRDAGLLMQRIEKLDPAAGRD